METMGTKERQVKDQQAQVITEVNQREIKPGKYEHYKGGIYYVLDIARHTETEEVLVVYKSLYSSPNVKEGAIWVRPLQMFLESVQVNGETIPRFKYIGGE